MGVRSVCRPNRVTHHGVATFVVSIDDALDIGGWAILAHFDLRLYASDAEFHPHDGAKLAGNEVGRRVVDGPRMWQICLMMISKPTYQLFQPCRVIVYDKPSVHMRCDVVPRRYDASVL